MLKKAFLGAKAFDAHISIASNHRIAYRHINLTLSSRRRSNATEKGLLKSHLWSELTTAVIPAKAGIHFDFSPNRAATILLLRGVRVRNPNNSPFVFVFDSAPPRPGVKTSERGGEKSKAKMDSGFRRNDGQNPKPGAGLKEIPLETSRPRNLPRGDWPAVRKRIS